MNTHFYDIILVDFEDSFTFNIAQYLYEISPNLKVISFEQMSAELLSSEGAQVLVLGPGPGHPDEYIPSISSWLELAQGRDNIFTVGICLGHQILLKRAGFTLGRAAHPIHGQSLEVSIFDWPTTEVQFYNSLFARGESEVISTCSNEHQEILAARGERFISYQFHPESVGTNYPSMFFGPVREFLYNKKNED